MENGSSLRISLALALLGLVIAVAEYRRAERAETALRAGQQALWDEIVGLRKADIDLTRMLLENARAVRDVTAQIAPPSPVLVRGYIAKGSERMQ